MERDPNPKYEKPEIGLSPEKTQEQKSKIKPVAQGPKNDFERSEGAQDSLIAISEVSIELRNLRKAVQDFAPERADILEEIRQLELKTLNVKRLVQEAAQKAAGDK